MIMIMLKGPQERNAAIGIKNSIFCPPTHTWVLGMSFLSAHFSAWLHERICHCVSITKPFPGEFHCFSNRIFVKGLLFCLKKVTKMNFWELYSTKQLERERDCLLSWYGKRCKRESPPSLATRINSWRWRTTVSHFCDPHGAVPLLENMFGKQLLVNRCCLFKKVLNTLIYLVFGICFFETGSYIA